MIDRNHTNSYLIKRDPEFSGGHIERKESPSKRYSESVITSQNRMPASSILKAGDVIHVAEKGGTVYAKAVLVADPETIVELVSIEDAVRFASGKKDDHYWMDKLVRFEDKKRSNTMTVLRYQEYVVAQELREYVVQPSGPISRLFARGFAHSLARLTDEEASYLNTSRKPMIGALEPDIPRWLRLQIHSLFNREQRDEHWFDIDHFVPRSLGGPGNIPENLVPIGMSLNRHKSNSLPVAFLRRAVDVGLAQSIEMGDIDLNGNSLLKPSKHHWVQGLAQRINGQLKTEFSTLEARKFYLSVMKYAYPAYATIVESFESPQDIHRD